MATPWPLEDFEGNSIMFEYLWNRKTTGKDNESEKIRTSSTTFPDCVPTSSSLHRGKD